MSMMSGTKVIGNIFARQLGLVTGSILVLCIAAFGGSRCYADTYSFYPSSSAGDATLGTSHTYTGSGSSSITAYGFECDSVFGGGDTACLSGTNVPWYVSVDATDLHTKNDGTDERGVGIANDPLGDNEISNQTFIDLDMTHLGATSGTLTISSLQSGESFFFCYGNSNSGWNSNSCTAEVTGAGTNMTESFNLGAYKDISLIADSRDVLLSSVTTTGAPTPEPESLSLLGTGLLGLVGIAKRRFKS